MERTRWEIMITVQLSLQTLRRFIPYLTAYAKDIWLAVLLGIINGIATVVMTLQIGQSIDQMIGEGQVRFNRLFHLLIRISKWNSRLKRTCPSPII